MTVAVILTRKGRDVVTTPPDTSMGAVCDLLETKGIGAVVISHGGGRVDGIFSERDFVRAIARQGAAALEKPVSEFMTENVEVCSPDDSVSGLMRRMTEGKFRHMPVVDENGHMLGLVSIGDAVSGRLKELSAEKEALTGMIMGS